MNKGKLENKRIFDHFLKHKDEIEKTFGASLVWERMDEKVTSRIKWQLDGVSVFNEDDYPKMNEFLMDGIDRMKASFTRAVRELK